MLLLSPSCLSSWDNLQYRAVISSWFKTAKGKLFAAGRVFDCNITTSLSDSQTDNAFPNSIIPRCLETVCCLFLFVCSIFSEVIPYQTLHFGNGILRGVRSGMGFHNISCIPDFIFTHHLRCGSYFVLHIVHPFKYKTISCIKRDRKRTAAGTAPRESHPGPC